MTGFKSPGFIDISSLENEKKGTSYIADVKRMYFLFNLSTIEFRLLKRVQLSC